MELCELSPMKAVRFDHTGERRYAQCVEPDEEPSSKGGLQGLTGQSAILTGQLRLCSR